MTVKSLSLLAIALCLGISGCSTAITATRDTPIQDDKGTRTFGSKIDDSLIETKVEVNVAKAATDLGNGASRIVVTSFNGVVLLAGQTPRADLKAQAEQAAAAVQRVKKVHNELQVMDPITLLAISNDALLTTKIKAQMLTDNAIPGSRIKVVTDNGIVYLMGLLTQAEATRAANLVQGVSGVQKIVTIDKQCWDKHVGQVIDHQVQHRAVKTWQHGADVDPSCQRAIDAIDHQRQAQPQQAGLGRVFQQRQGGQKGQHHTGSGEAVGAPGFKSGYMQGRYHGRFSKR